MKDFAEYLVKTIVDSPESVVVNEQNDGQGYITLSLTVAPTDMGKIIGKNGRIIKAVRDLVKILAIKENVKVNLTLTEV
ncbi:KH domain-containing protein [Candidatus Microgenomates bacterium]|nr:KH domain-containing protein [Candidatus Microgenomates bacterium]